MMNRAIRISLLLCLCVVTARLRILPVQAQTGDGIICTRVYLDRNSNGFFDPNESLLEGVAVSLDGEDLTYPARYTTGVVSVPECVDALAPGLYTVSVQAPQGMTHTSPGHIQIRVGAGEKLTVEAGLSQSAMTTDVCALIYSDHNRNGTRDEGEGPVSGGMFTLYDSDTGLVAGTHQSDGREPYCFSGLRESEFWVTSELPADWQPTTRQDWPVKAPVGSTANLEFGASNSGAGAEPPAVWLFIAVFMVTMVMPFASLTMSVVTLLFTVSILRRLDRMQHPPNNTP